MPAKQKVVGEESWALLILDACGNVHTDGAFKALMHGNRVLCWYGEADMTNSYQPMDATYGKLCRELALGPNMGLEHWLWASKRHREMWDGKKGTVDLQLRRQMALKWIGRAWAYIHDEQLPGGKYPRLHHNVWTKTGCLITADGSTDHEIKPQGLEGYVVPE